MFAVSQLLSIVPVELHDSIFHIREVSERFSLVVSFKIPNRFHHVNKTVANTLAVYNIIGFVYVMTVYMLHRDVAGMFQATVPVRLNE